MANLSAVKLPSGTTYDIKDKNALPLTGGQVTGPVTFGDSVSIDEATVGDLIVNGSASFTNNIQANTINGVAVGNDPKFTDTNTITTATTTGSGNAVTAITASNGALTVTKGSTFLTGITSSQVTTALGFTPYNSTNPNGYTTNTGTVTKVTAGTGLSIGTTAGGNFTTTGTINHTNSVTAQTTQAVYPIKIDAQGHISAYGSAQTILSLGTGSGNAFRGDYGNSAYTHAVTNKGSAFSSGLYKITTNSEGHVTAATAVAKADITGLGIPAQDTTYTFDGTYNASTNKAATVNTVKNALIDTNLTGNTIAESIDTDELVTGSLIVNGDARFANNIYGDVTGTLTGNVVGNVSGSAGTAGAFTSAKSITLTGDVTGSASSTGGWSIATTVGDDSHNHTADTIMVPKITKSYTGVIASANNHDNAALYCIKIVPNSYAGQWYLKYRVFANMDGISDANGHGYEESYVYINGMRNTYASYRTWNNVSNTSYRPYYYHSIYRAKEAGATTYGHVMGINLYNSYNPTNTTYKRNVTFEILDYGGCTISFLDAPTKYASIPGTGSTNYDGRTDFDGTTQGNTMSGDRNTTITYGTLDYYFRPYAGQALYRYKYVMQGEDNRIYPITITNQADATQVAKVPTTVGLRPWKIWFYNSTTTINAGAVIGAQTLQETGYTTTAVYNFNADIPTYQMIYLKGTYNATKDLFYLYNNGSSPCTSYYTLVPDNTANITLSNYFAEGYYYVLLGASYSSANYITLFGNHPLYYFDGTNLKEVARTIPDWNENDSSSPSYIENRTHYRTSLGYTKPVATELISDDADSHTIVINNVSYTYGIFITYDIIGDLTNTFVNVNASSTTALATINNSTTTYNLSISKDEDSSSLYLYNNDICIHLWYSDEDYHAFNYIEVYTNDYLANFDSFIINIPTINEQFNYLKKLDSGYLNGKLITSGTGLNSEIFNNITHNEASGNSSHAEGNYTIASGANSHAEGTRTIASGESSHAEGVNVKAFGLESHAEGGYTRAYGDYSHAEGYGWAEQVQVTLTGSAMGRTFDVTNTPTLYDTQKYRVKGAEIRWYENNEEVIAKITNANYTSENKLVSITTDKYISSTDITNQSYYILFRNVAEGRYSHVEGFGCTAGYEAAHAEGHYTYAYYNAHSEGDQTTAVGQSSHAEGRSTIADGSYSHAEGYVTTASGQESHSEGDHTIASSYASHAEGRETTASGYYTHAEGYGTTASGNYSHAEGGPDNSSTSLILTGEANATTYTTTSSTTYSPQLLIGCKIGSSIITGITYSEKTLSSIIVDKTLSTSAISNKTYTISSIYTTAESSTSHAEGGGTKSSGNYSHAEGWRAYTFGFASHAEGGGTIASGSYSHAEGQWTVASGNYSHAEGGTSSASGNYSHAEGISTVASGNNSHAEGWGATASGINSHAEGYRTTAQRKSQHVFGEFNVLDTGGTDETTRGTYVEIVGKGTGNTARSNARTLDWSGNEVLAGKLTVGAGPTNNMDVATKQYVDNAVGSGGGGGSSTLMVVTVDSGNPDKTFSEILAHLNNGGTAVLHYSGSAFQLGGYSSYGLDFYKTEAVDDSSEGIYDTWTRHITINTNNTWRMDDIWVGRHPSYETPQPLGTASYGTSESYSRADHVHPLPTLSISGNTITLTGAAGSTSSITLPIYNGGVS